MKIKTLEVAGLESALHAMRNPMDSWKMSDSKYDYLPKVVDDFIEHVDYDYAFIVGEKDKDLSVRLQKSGPEHCKHLRMVMVWADIAAPRYWWQEFDTYRAGVEKVSCSTMHKLMSRDVTVDDFEHDQLLPEALQTKIVDEINRSIHAYKMEDDPAIKADIFRGVVQFLPQSYIQKRTVMMSYAALRNICRQREGHKLKEWHQFLDWTKTLPESWMIYE